MKKTATAIMAAALTLSLSVGAYASDQAQTVIESKENSTSISIVDITPREEENKIHEKAQRDYTVGSFYPIEIQSAEDNGYRLLVKSFLVPQDTDPQTLIEEELVRRGVEYRVSDILRKELEGSTETKEVSQSVAVTTDSKGKEVLLSSLAPSIQYDENGFIGTLTLDMDSISSEVAEQESYSYVLKDTKEFTALQRNDPYYIPKSSEKNGVTLELKDIQWTSMASAAENSDVPSMYNATAVYSGTAWGSKASEYLVRANYSGEVSKVTEGEVLYSIVYEEIPEIIEVSSFPWDKVLMISAVLLLMAGLAAGSVWLLKSDLFKKQKKDQYMEQKSMDLPDMLREMDRGLEEE